MKEQLILIMYRNISGDIHIESLRASEAGNCFRIESIPLFAPSVSLGDIVSVIDDGSNLHFEMVIDPSGNSTIQVRFLDEVEIEPLTEFTQHMGCSYIISSDKKSMAVNIPLDVQYSRVQDYFEKGEEQGKWTFRESNQMHY